MLVDLVLLAALEEPLEERAECLLSQAVSMEYLETFRVLEHNLPHRVAEKIK